MQADEATRAYVYSTVLHNVRDISILDTHIKFCMDFCVMSIFEEFADEESKEYAGDRVFIINNKDKIAQVCDFFGADCLMSLDIKKDISHVLKKSDAECKEFIKAYFEKYGDISRGPEKVECSITGYSRQHLDAISAYLGIPCERSRIHSLEQISYSGVNAVDFLGAIYTNRLITKPGLYDSFLKIVNDRPILRYTMESYAVAPTKANYSDVGYDLSVVGVSKELTPKTKLYSTGIRLDIPVGYYVEIVPRSSISKSGYILSNSVGIIDCSYRGELLVALTKIDDSMPDITFPFRCCQLIMKRQVFPEMVEASLLEKSRRDDGGFGSSG